MESEAAERAELAAAIMLFFKSCRHRNADASWFGRMQLQVIVTSASPRIESIPNGCVKKRGFRGPDTIVLRQRARTEIAITLKRVVSTEDLLKKHFWCLIVPVD
jgi:hypothetical protein